MESEKAIGEIINIGNDEELSVLDTAKLIHQLAGPSYQLKIKYVPMAEIFGKYKDIMRRIPDLTKAKRILNFKPKYKLADAIKITIDEINRKNKNA
jgi:UDP-glucose 4-epimerase